MIRQTFGIALVVAVAVDVDVDVDVDGHEDIGVVSVYLKSPCKYFMAGQM